MLTSISLFLALLSVEPPRGPKPAVVDPVPASHATSPSNPSLPPREGGVNHQPANAILPASLPWLAVLSPLPFDEQDQGSYVPAEAMDEEEEREEEGSEGQAQANLDPSGARPTDSHVSRLATSHAPHSPLLTDRRRSTRGPPSARFSA